MTEKPKILRPYQAEAGNAIWESVNQHKGLTITVEIARQGGKNELSAQLEAWILFKHAEENANLIKCSPTFKPQTITSMLRLKEKLNAEGWEGEWQSEMGYMIRFGACRAIFLSAEESANVVGNTAHLLLEVDEAQDVSEEKYSKEFKPMGSTTNVTNVLYGTTWDDSTLLEKTKQINLEMERKDGIKRHFRYDWQEIAQYNPDYLTYVEGERRRLGENHPLFLTQYRLLPVRGGGGFLNTLQKQQLQGAHKRLKHGEGGKIYVAGIDLAGEAETDEDNFKKTLNPRQDSTVVTIGEMIYDSRSHVEKKLAPGTYLDRGSWDKLKINETQPNSSINPKSSILNQLPAIKIVDHQAWTGRKHAELYPTLVDLIQNVWHCRAVVVDATGIGQPVASFLRQALGSRIIPFNFSAPAKSELGFNLLAAINSGRLKMYAADNTPEYQEFWHEIERAKGYYRASQTMNFFVDASDGHDDYLMSLALLVEAGEQFSPRKATGN
jgi:hypothetical protein